MKAVILEGGLGTRLRPLTLSTPKPVAPVVDRPFLRHQLDMLSAAGVGEVVFSVAYHPEQVEAIVRRRIGGLWHDLAYACLVEGDVAAVRSAVKESRARLPLNLKNYIYLIAGNLPASVRRRIFARGRRVHRPGAEMSPR